MISTLEKEITFRFLKARKNDGFLNIISIFSFIGIGLGVAVLIIVMSVMNGFRTELINKIVGFNAHITVKPYGDKFEINDEKRNYFESVLTNLIESILVDLSNHIPINYKNFIEAAKFAGNNCKINNPDSPIAELALIENFPSSKIKNLNSKCVYIFLLFFTYVKFFPNRFYLITFWKRLQYSYIIEISPSTNIIDKYI